VIDDQSVQTAPAFQREIHGFGGERRVRHVAGEYFDALRAVLVVQLVEGGVCPGDEDEFVRVREEVVRGCEADAWWVGEWGKRLCRGIGELENFEGCLVN
jgi:hypothetical protein